MKPSIGGLIPPASTVGTSLVPMLRNRFAPGKNHAYSRYGSLTTIRSSSGGEPPPVHFHRPL